MAKKRSCRRTEEEDRQHELAVKVRKMTDKQIADLLENKDVRPSKQDPERKYTREDLDNEFLKGHTIGKSEHKDLVYSLQRQIEMLTKQSKQRNQVVNSQQRLNREQIRRLPKDQQAAARQRNNSLLSEQQINKIKRETTEKVADRAFGLAVGVVTHVLKDKYWKKTYKKKLPEYVRSCMELKEKVDSNTMNQFIREINDLCGIDLLK